MAGSSTRVVNTNVTRTMTRAGEGHQEHHEVGSRLACDTEMARGDQGEHDQRDDAAERGDRREVEPDGEDHGDDGGDQQPGRDPVAEAATETGGNWPMDVICSQSPPAG